jgi:hypothetical protein
LESPVEVEKTRTLVFKTLEQWINRCIKPSSNNPRPRCKEPLRSFPFPSLPKLRFHSSTSSWHIANNSLHTGNPYLLIVYVTDVPTDPLHPESKTICGTGEHEAQDPLTTRFYRFCDSFFLAYSDRSSSTDQIFTRKLVSGRDRSRVRQTLL